MNSNISKKELAYGRRMERETAFPTMRPNAS